MMIQPTIQVAILGWSDSLVLMVMALVVFGPRRLPEIGRKVGKIMYEVRKASNDFKFQMEEELRSSEEADRRKKEEERRLAAPAQVAGTVESALASETRPNSTEASPYPGEWVYPTPSALETATEASVAVAEPPAEPVTEQAHHD